MNKTIYTTAIPQTILHILPAIALIFAVISCEKDIEFNGSESSPKPVLNAFLSSGETVGIRLTESRFFLYPAVDEPFKPITDATVHLRNEAGQTIPLAHTGNGYYSTDYRPASNTRLNILATFPTGMADIESTTDIPAPPLLLPTHDSLSILIDTFIYNFSTIPAQINFKCENMNLSFIDPVQTTDYYRLLLTLRRTNSNGTITHSNIQFGSSDIVFGTKEDEILEETDKNRYKVFSDEIINGKEHTINLHWNYMTLLAESDSFGSSTYDLIVELQHITKDCYLYFKSLGAAQNPGDFGNLISEPVQVYTNVTNGIGIFAAYTSTKNTYRIASPEGKD
ncbi:MAG: DUF4249 domain-containing protein [Tannerellaceae bacterium]|nr:DUF4249 domain-containing protein [Tannerellaceae bacterium]